MTLRIAPDRMLIGGELCASESGEWDESINPATEEVIGRSPSATAKDVSRAVDAAENAWPAWASLTVAERADHMRNFGRRILERSEELLKIEVADTGNTIRPMRGDVGSAVKKLNYFAGIATELKGQTIPATANNIHMTWHEPYGVVARIAPFNHPILFAVAGTAAALAAGNSVIVKPPETSPLSSMLLAEIARDTLPPGVFNIVTGRGAVVGDAIVRHPKVKRIAFIGSTQPGRAIQRAAAEVCVKHISLELGGKNPLIAFPDADVEAVANAAIGGMNFGWQGQSCGSTSRLLLHADIYQGVVDRIVDKLSSYKIGDPLSDQSDMGPVNSQAQLRKVEYFIDSAKRDGARLLLGGKRPQGEQFERGFWIEPTVYGDVTPSMEIWTGEVFGPLLSIGRWSDFDEAVKIANEVEYGLTAAIWTNDIKNALRMARKIRAGHLWINGFGAHYLGVPFGGMKESGVGRDGGIEELYSYTETKSVNIIL